jgi:hypothetical protein
MFPPRFTRQICRCYRREVAQIIIQNPIANRLAADGRRGARRQIPNRDRAGRVAGEVDALKRLEPESAAESDALLSAILDGAFAGNL